MFSIPLFPDVISHKICAHCGRDLPYDAFGRDSKSIDGKHRVCKECKCVINEKSRVKYIEKRREYSRSYYYAHREQVLETVRKYVKQNPDKMRNRRREYKRRRVDVVRANYHTREARKAGLPADYTADDWNFALSYFNGQCAVCGQPLLGLFHRPNADHWIPISNPNSPGTVRENMLPLCSPCNLSKHARDPREWLTEKFGPRRAARILKAIEDYFEVVKGRGK